MTGSECYQAALTLLAETAESAGYYDGFAVGGLNQLLANCRWEIRALCERDGLPPPAGPLRIDGLEEALPADDAMVRECFPYGLAALLICDDDKAKFNWCASEFAERLSRHCPASLTPIEEMY